ncbi:glucokinase [Sphingomonas sp. F9_3S_D5_B_2]
MSSSLPDARPWLLVEASAQGVLRVATATPSPRPRLQAVREIDITGVPTFTDGLQRVEREQGVTLHGTRCVIAMAGATSGEALSLVRSRWTITRSGLAAIFEHPVMVLNDVAARAWAVRSGSATVGNLRGIGAPAFDKPARFVMIMVEEGVGAAIVDVDRTGHMRVLETEAGHMDFAPLSQAEFQLSQALKGNSPAASWERLLMVDRNDPLWASACPQMLDPERPRLQSELLGRFAVNLVHAYGAWNGVMLTGSRVNRILEAGGRSAFDSSFAGRRNFARLIGACPVWRVDQHEAVLTGTAERLAYNMQSQARAAA